MMQAWLPTVLTAGALCGCELGYVAPYEDDGVPVGTYTSTACAVDALCGLLAACAALARRLLFGCLFGV